MLNFIASRLRLKLTLAFIAVLLIPTIAITAYTLNTTTSSLVTLAQNSALSAVKEKTNNVSKALEKFSSDLVFLSQSPTTVAYIHALEFPTLEDQSATAASFF